jgi:hypothetical protein
MNSIILFFIIIFILSKIIRAKIINILLILCLLILKNKYYIFINLTIDLKITNIY